MRFNPPISGEVGPEWSILNVLRWGINLKGHLQIHWLPNQRKPCPLRETLFIFSGVPSNIGFGPLWLGIDNNNYYYMVVSTNPFETYDRQLGSSTQVRVKMIKIWNHQLEKGMKIQPLVPPSNKCWATVTSQELSRFFSNQPFQITTNQSQKNQPATSHPSFHQSKWWSNPEKWHLSW